MKAISVDHHQSRQLSYVACAPAWQEDILVWFQRRSRKQICSTCYLDMFQSLLSSVVGALIRYQGTTIIITLAMNIPITFTITFYITLTNITLTFITINTMIIIITIYTITRS